MSHPAVAVTDAVDETVLLGDLMQVKQADFEQVAADVRGDLLELKNTINAIVDQRNGFVSEVPRVAREFGAEGKPGQAAAVTIEVGGVWTDLSDDINWMAGSTWLS